MHMRHVPFESYNAKHLFQIRVLLSFARQRENALTFFQIRDLLSFARQPDLRAFHHVPCYLFSSSSMFLLLFLLSLALEQENAQNACMRRVIHTHAQNDNDILHMPHDHCCWSHVQHTDATSYNEYPHIQDMHSTALPRLRHPTRACLLRQIHGCTDVTEALLVHVLKY